MIHLLGHYLRRSILGILIGSVGLFAFTIFAGRMFQRITERAGNSRSLTRMMPKWMQNAFQIESFSLDSINGFLAIILQHPFLLSILLILPIALITAFFTGDVEKRTLAMVLTRPISRLAVAVSVFAVVAGSLLVLIGVIAAGITISARQTGLTAELNLDLLLQALINLTLLIFAFTGIGAAVSTLTTQRGDAVGWCLTIVLVMYVWNFLSQIWGETAPLPNYSLFHFYPPADIMIKGMTSDTNLAILAGTGAAGWLVAFVVFRLRNFSI